MSVNSGNQEDWFVRGCFVPQVAWLASRIFARFPVRRYALGIGSPSLLTAGVLHPVMGGFQVSGVWLQLIRAKKAGGEMKRGKGGGEVVFS